MAWSLSNQISYKKRVELHIFFLCKDIKIRNEAGVSLWENIFQTYDMIITCLDVDQKTFPQIEKAKLEVNSNITFLS